MTEAVAHLLKEYRNLSDDEQAEFLDRIEEVDPLLAIQAEPGFDEFLAERLAEAEDPSKLGTMDELYAKVLLKAKARKS